MKLVTKNLTKRYNQKTAVDNLNLSIEDNKVLGLLGPNGSGKSTTIKMLTGQTHITSGTVQWEGKEYTEIPKELKNQIGIMPQEIIVWEHLSVKENLEYTGRLQGLSSKDLKAQLSYLISQLQLTKEVNTLARNLSGGFKRRLNLAISIIHEPDLIFLDEPTPGIDPQNRRFLWEFINNYKETKNKSIVLTDHYLDEAEKVCDYVVIVDEGKVIAEGTVSELKKKYLKSNVIIIEIPEESLIQIGKIDNLVENLESRKLTVEKVNNQINVTTDEVPDNLQIILDSLSKNDLKTDHITVKESTLEDVFILLTGKDIRE